MLFDVSWEQFELFLYVDKALSKKPSSAYANYSRFNIFSRWFADKDWSVTTFRLFLNEYQQKKASQGTINKLITFGKYFDEFLGTEVTKSFKTRTEKIKKIEDILTPAEITQLANLELPYSKYREYLNQRQQALIMLLGTTGCRISEALELRWENMHNGVAKYVEFLDTKNGEDREVPVDSDVFEMMMALPRKSEFVFDSGRGGQLQPQQVNLDIQRRAKALGINKHVYNHLFRHSFATTMLEMGVSDSDVCKITGWRDPKVLLRYKNSKVSYYASVMRLHPLLQFKMSWKERADILTKQSEKLFEPNLHTISVEVSDGKMLLIITPKNEA